MASCSPKNILQTRANTRKLNKNLISWNFHIHKVFPFESFIMRVNAAVVSLSMLSFTVLFVVKEKQRTTGKSNLTFESILFQLFALNPLDMWNIFPSNFRLKNSQDFLTQLLEFFQLQMNLHTHTSFCSFNFCFQSWCKARKNENTSRRKIVYDFLENLNVALASKSFL